MLFSGKTVKNWWLKSPVIMLLSIMLEWETLPTFPHGAHKLALKHLDAYICILIRILYLLKAFTLELVMWHLLAWTYVLLIALICWFNELWCWQVVVNISQWLKLGGKVRLAAGVLAHDVVHGVVATRCYIILLIPLKSCRWPAHFEIGAVWAAEFYYSYICIQQPESFGLE